MNSNFIENCKATVIHRLSNLINVFGSSVTDDSLVDETGVWRTELEAWYMW